MNKNEKWKLKAVLVIGMAHRAEDISSKGVIWSSSNEKVLSVNNSGLVTAIGEGTASIIAKYKTEEGVIISNSYKIEVKDNNKKSNNNGNNGGKNNVNKNPQPVKSKTNTLNKVEISNVGSEDVKVIATGGLSTLINSETDSIDYVDRFLTLDGLRLIYLKNK